MPEHPSPGWVTIQINGKTTLVPAGTMLASALLQAGVPCRTSVTGEPRTALCGMGICFECRATIDGIPHRRTCQVLCRDAMTVETQP